MQFSRRRGGQVKDILLQVDSYPDPTPREAIEQAVNFAAVAGATLSALSVEIDIRVPANRIADLLINLSRQAEEEEKKSRRACEAALASFTELAGARNVLGQALAGRAEMYLIGEYVAERARTRDLCMVPIAERLDGQRSVAEDVVFGSGRPTLVFRPAGAPLPEQGLGTVVLAWDGSRSAARVMADALPLLAKAREVRVLTVVNEKPEARSGLGADVVRHLQAHGVTALAEEVDAARQSIGKVLEVYASQHGADLLVMGAYGRSRVREFILGGATEYMLNDSKVPLLLSH